MPNERKTEKNTCFGKVVLYTIPPCDHPPCHAGDGSLPCPSGVRLPAFLRTDQRTDCPLCFGVTGLGRRRFAGTLRAVGRGGRISHHAALFSGAGDGQRGDPHLCDHVHIRFAVGHKAELVSLYGAGDHVRRGGGNIPDEPGDDIESGAGLRAECGSGCSVSAGL